VQHVAVDNRLTAEQLAALAPGDPVTIEITADFRKPRYSTGTIARLEGSCIVVSWRTPRGMPYHREVALPAAGRFGCRARWRVRGFHHELLSPRHE
jgi:hypothetical protein